MYNANTKKLILPKDVTLHKSYDKWCNVEKPVLIPVSNKVSDDEENVEMVLTNNQKIIILIVGDSKNDDEAEENIFENMSMTRSK